MSGPFLCRTAASSSQTSSTAVATDPLASCSWGATRQRHPRGARTSKTPVRIGTQPTAGALRLRSDPVGLQRTGLVRYRGVQPLLHRYRVTRPALRLSFTPRSQIHDGASASHRSSLAVLDEAAVAYPREHLRRGDGSTRPLRCLPHSGGGHTLRCSPSRMLLPEPECRPLTPSSTQRRLNTSDDPTRAHLFQSTATALPMAQATSCNA